MNRYKRHKKGWFNESYRHSLASKGVKSVSNSFKIGEKSVKRNLNRGIKGDIAGEYIEIFFPAGPGIGYSKKRLKDQAEFYDFLWERNEGIFYRGTSNGKGLGFGVMGKGIYISWERGMAKGFANISSEKIGGKPKVIRYKLPKDIKLLDAQSKTMGDIKRSLGVQSWDKIGDKVFASILTHEIQKRGYDGVISDSVADGIVIFDESKVQEISESKINYQKVIIENNKFHGNVKLDFDEIIRRHPLEVKSVSSENYQQLYDSGVKLKKNEDIDGDGIINIKDKQPLNPKI